MIRRLGHLLALSSFALAEPLFDLLGKNPEFFSVRGTGSWEIVLFALALTLALPLVLVALEELARLADRRAGELLHLAFVGGLGAVVALLALRRAGGPAAVSLLAAAAIGAAFAFAYRRAAPLRSMLTLLAAAPVAFLALFLLESPASKLVLPEEAKAHVVEIHAKTPVVLIVFDEFPTNSLLDARRRIDPVRFPNFAALAAHSYFFRSATTTHEGTTGAVPAILTGQYAEPGQLPRYADHPGNLFTLLGGSYRLVAYERETRLCPPGLCREDDRSSFGGRLASIIEDSSVVYGHLLLPKGLARELPSVSESWEDFLHQGQDEVARFGRFLGTLRSSPRPELFYAHLLLPHSPWQYLPDGTRYSLHYPVPPWSDAEVWTDDEGLVLQNWQRHLLQLVYVDTLLGRLVARLHAGGLYDRSLVIVTADEGIGFHAGWKRRPVHPDNLHTIAYVPLFVKLPGQERGQLVTRHVETVDVLPTVAAVLGIRIPWRVDGRPALSPDAALATVSVEKGSGRRIEAASAQLERRRWAELDRQLALFGSNTPPSRLYGIGRFQDLLGEAAPEAAPASVRLDARSSPLEVSGRVSGAGNVAVVAGGRIAAVVPVYRGRFWALLPAPAKDVRIVALSN